jgi:putative chitobiose transport system substrate-binding protein
MKKLLAAVLLSVFVMAQAQTEIEFWTYYLSPNFDDYFNSLIAQFEAENPDIKIKWTDKQDTMERDLAAAISLGNPPDVVNLWNDSTFAGAQNGFLTPLTELPGVTPEFLAETYWENVSSIFTVDGVPYGFPWYGWVDQGVMAYNSELLKQAGVDVASIQTLDDLLAASATIKEKTGSYGWLPSIKDPNGASFLGTFFLDGLAITDEAGQAVFNSPEHAALLQKYIDLMKAGTIPEDLLRKEAFQLTMELYSQGQAAFIVGGPQALTRVKDANADIYGKTMITTAPLGKAGIQTGGGMDIVVPAASDNKEAATEFAKFVTSNEQQVAFAKVVPIVPTTKGAESDPAFELTDTTDAILIAQAMVGTKGSLINPSFTPPKNTDDIFKNFNDNIEAAFLGAKTAQEALDDAVEFWNSNLGE